MAKKKAVEPTPIVEEPAPEVVVAPLASPPSAPGQTGQAPLTRPPQRDERKWQQ